MPLSDGNAKIELIGSKLKLGPRLFQICSEAFLFHKTFQVHLIVFCGGNIQDPEMFILSL